MLFASSEQPANYCQEVVIHGTFTAYLKEKGKTNNITQFRGNRFNILFYNGGIIYDLLDDVITFLDKTQIPNTLAKLCFMMQRNLGAKLLHKH
jgi:hypothetical protein